MMKRFMKRCGTLILGFALAVGVCPAAQAAAAPPAVSSYAYLVMDADTGQVLIEKNADEMLYPASITKVMTLGLAAQKAGGDWSSTVTVSEEAVYSLWRTDSSHIALQPGEEVPLRDIVYATQLASANDGANVLAEYIGGSIEGGVAAMNAQVQALGLTNTHFENPHGLHDGGHYTTARDMATIARWALSQPGYLEVFCHSGNYEMAPTNLQPETRYFACDDWLKVGNICYREYAKGGKDGYHSEAHYTYVNYSEQDDIRLICVILAAPSKQERYYDACALLDYCFGSFRRVDIPAEDRAMPLNVQGGGGVLGQVNVIPAAGSVLLHEDADPADCTVEYDLPDVWNLGTPLSAEQIIRIPASGGQAAGEVRVTMTQTGLDALLRQMAANSEAEAERSSGGFTALFVGGGAAAVLALLLWRQWWTRQGRKAPAAVGADFPILQWEGETVELNDRITKLRRPDGTGRNLPRR
ncbi:MAG: D-alanyl-D-alanine carboxypeptidase [Oscillospiraceae bacterium]|nr:D-alanyl-D-alanine carboxypeptidase [Oscillospiraceae bacterium]